MYAIRQSCCRALQARAPLPFSAAITRRAFSQTPVSHRGALPVFLSPSSPELEELLSKTNRRILLPRHLTEEQARLVFRKKNKARIEAEPIEITLGEVTLPLEHIDRNVDIPAFKLQLYEILALSKTKEDWENVVRTIEGYVNAGIRIKSVWAQKVVRLLGENGMQHLILKAVQRASATGINLKDFEVTVQVLDAMRSKAANSGWEKEELEKALKMTEQVVELMDDEVHLGKVSDLADDHRTHPFVISVPLELAAELAYRHEGSTDKVKKYAPRLMDALKQRDFLQVEIDKIRAQIAASQEEQQKHKRLREHFFSLCTQIRVLVPIWNSLSTARTALGADMPMEAQAEATQKALREVLEEARAALDVILEHDSWISKTGPEAFRDKAVQLIDQCLDGEE